MLWVGSFMLFLFFISFSFLFSSEVYILEWDFLFFDLINMSASFIVDFFSILFFSTVVMIVSMVYFFSQYYMNEEKNFKGFLILLLFFVLSMIFLIFSPNLVFLLLGWDGLGVVSYLLVVFYSNYSSSVAGMLTFLVNRLGDVFFFLSICFFSFLLDWNFMESVFVWSVVAMVLILAFITKSAQIPFSSWLPAAMAAPTPVSSLVHSSTLVTAGVFLLVRFHKLLVFSNFWLLVLSVMTILMAGIMANLDWDLKKIIAFSTLSQLGFMISSFSCGMILFCFFHLLTHALFKASLFMCSGVIIHVSDNNQDFRNSTNFLKALPLLSVVVSICLLCLCGFPFTSGFFSKDLILDGGSLLMVIFFFFLLGVMMTFSYSLRFSFYMMNVKPMVRSKIFSSYEQSAYILFPIWCLVFLALILGGFWLDLLSYFSFLLFVGVGWKIFYFFFIFLFVVFTIMFFNNYLFFLKYYFFSSMWFLTRNVGLLGFRWVFFWSENLMKILDQGWLEKLGGGGLIQVNYFFSINFLRQTSFLFSFFFFSFIFFLL